MVYPPTSESINTTAGWLLVYGTAFGLTGSFNTKYALFSIMLHGNFTVALQVPSIQVKPNFTTLQVARTKPFRYTAIHKT